MKKKTSLFKIVAPALALLVLLAGCTGRVSTRGGTKVKVTDLILATTTSTQDTGLLDELMPAFEKRYPFRVKTIAVGSGEALAMGAKGEADVLLVHSPKSEEEFVAAGNSSSRKPVMHNRFLLVGPKADPAKAGDAESAPAALAAIANAQATFISRADESGTHKKELSLWEKAAIKPAGSWYIESGQGMGETLRIADEKGAYTLVDEGTYLAIKASLALTVVKGGDQGLNNPYTVIVVNEKKFPKVNTEGAQAFSRFVTGPAGQALIGKFGRGKFGKPLFTTDVP
ncbi:MAG: substrate-binding domain-containing protein [Actinomycetota bacterium]|nr:substrate-binding domain-containing protein [Actinomycetota bacterium]